MSIEYSEALALSLSLGVSEFINASNCLSQVSTHMSNQFKEVVFIECLCWNPKCYVFEACRVLAVGFKLLYIPTLELPQESWVLTPEQSDVLDVE